MYVYVMLMNLPYCNLIKRENVKLFLIIYCLPRNIKNIKLILKNNA